MSKEIKEKTKLRLVMFLCIFGFLFFQVMNVVSNRLGISAYNGVMLACQFGLCIIMVRKSYKVGAIVSTVLMSINIINIAVALIRFHRMGTLPGLCNSLIFLITLIILAKQFSIREKEAITDFLTGLYNRRGLYNLLKLSVQDEKTFHVVYIDLGNFKFINDNYGHAVGDILLRVVADRMGKVVGNGGTITRIGGDEFVIVLDGRSNPEEVANNMLDAISEKVSVVVEGSKVECYLTAYAGIASYPKHATDHENLIKYADIAMYQATKSESDRVCFFDKEMEQYLNRQMELEKLIKEGLEKDYFYLVYQPQYKLEGKVLRGFETLIRMKTPDGQFVSPGEFIPVAEKGELIIQIDNYVLRRAMNEFKEIVEKKQDLVVSINVSAKNIGALDFADKIEKILKETGYPAKNLEIEITEYCLVQSVDITIANIKKLRALGVQVALDDFGTGYTSLSYLAKMPINLLKLDKSLIDDIEDKGNRLDFVNAIIYMGHIMNCEVIAEGVESENQLSLLKEQECDFVQGFVWGKPLDYKVAKDLASK